MWQYQKGNEQYGPLDEAAVTELIRNGTITFPIQLEAS